MAVVLVSMPFAEVQRPSIALGLLRAALAGTGISSKVVYGNLVFAETIGVVAYQAMQSAPTDHLLGEWCFARGLLSGPSENGAAERDDEYLDLVLDVRCNGFPARLEQRKELMRWIRAKADACVNEIAERIVACRPRIVGCSSVFQQHCASLALLKRIRELSPPTVLLMGGAKCEGEMGVATLQTFPWVDCVVSGDADGMFAELLVGRKVALHLLRTERDRHEVPLQVAGAGPVRAGRALPPPWHAQLSIRGQHPRHVLFQNVVTQFGRLRRQVLAFL